MKIQGKIKNLTFNEINFDNKINLLYAPNGTCKTVLFDYIIEKNNVLAYSYLKLLKENFNVVENTFNPEILKNFIENKQNEESKILKEYFLNNYNNSIKSLESVDYEKFIEKEKNIEKNKDSNFELLISDYKIIEKWFPKVDDTNYKINLLLSINKISKKIFGNFELEYIKTSIESLKKDKIELEKNIEPFEKEIKKLKKEIAKEKNKIISDTKKNEISKYEFEIKTKYDYLFKNCQNYFINNLKVPSNDSDFRNICSASIVSEVKAALLYLLENLFYFYRISSFFQKLEKNESICVIDELSKTNYENFNEKLKKTFEILEKNRYDYTIDKIVKFFNKYFFNYIKIKKIKLFDWFLNEKSNFYLKIFYYDKEINLNSQLSDGENNAINLIDFYINSMHQKDKEYVIIDDVTITLDIKNKIGLLLLLLDLVKKFNKKLILFSYDFLLIQEIYSFFEKNKIKETKMIYAYRINEMINFQNINPIIYSNSESEINDDTFLFNLSIFRNKIKMYYENTHSWISNNFFHYNYECKNYINIPIKVEIIDKNIKKFISEKFSNSGFFDFLENLVEKQKEKYPNCNLIYFRTNLSIYTRLKIEKIFSEYFNKNIKIKEIDEVLKTKKVPFKNDQIKEKIKNLIYYQSSYFHLDELNFLRILDINENALIENIEKEIKEIEEILKENKEQKDE